ncbi:Protein phosphatase 2C 2 [Dissophora ornata]|nr:Protein phosphatase 2C 2 [Dissophora ornata]
MGQALSAPVTDKHSSVGLNERFAYGASAMQGWRPSAGVSKYCGENLHKKIVADPAFVRGDYKVAIKNGFLETDRELQLGNDEDMKTMTIAHAHTSPTNLQIYNQWHLLLTILDPQHGGNSSGSTAITATITDENIVYVGNAGDSRAVLCSGGKGIALSTDHKPNNTGFVESGRVNGVLGLSRALGDLAYKSNDILDPEEQIVTGIWDCMSSQKVVSLVRKGIADKIPLATICEMTMDQCLAVKGTLTVIGCDNMTMVIVALLNGRTVEDWYKHVSSRVAIR